MNKARREELNDVTSFLDDAIDRLEEIKEDEEDSLNSMPESLQFSARGDKMQEAIDTIDGFVNMIEKVKGEILKMIKGK